MKKRTFPVMTIMLVTVFIFSGCKKENTAAQKDYTPLFKNTVWAGEFNYTSSPLQPVSIDFKEGGQFTWYELAGDFPGTWKIENGQVSVNFPSGSGFKAAISGDNKLTNIQNLAANGWTIVNAELDTVAAQVLDNTYWAGFFNEVGGTPWISFISPTNLREAGSPYSIPYTRKSAALWHGYSDGSIYYKHFSVLLPNNIIKGIRTGGAGTITYKLTKQ